MLRLVLIALLQLALAPFAAAQEPDPFSILAPPAQEPEEEEPEEEEAEPVEVEDAPDAEAQETASDEQDPFSILSLPPEEPVEEEVDTAEETPAPEQVEVETAFDAGFAGPHLSRAGYLAHRGETAPGARELVWRVDVYALDGLRLESRERRLVIGDDYVVDFAPDARLALDFRTERRLESDAALAMRNQAMSGYVHRRADLYSRFSADGTRDEIPLGPELVLERFWLEAAMGIANASAVLEVAETEDGATEVNREGLDAPLLTISGAREGGPRDGDLFRRWLRHALPIHPDALAAFDPDGGVPDRFDFIVISPDSPRGRRERWTLESDGALEDFALWPEDLPAADAIAYDGPTRLLETGLAATRAPGGAPSSQDFIAAAEIAEERGDLTAAYLTLYQASHHFGSCDTRPDLETCAASAAIGARGLGDPLFEALIGALSVATSDRASAVRGLSMHADGDGEAGAAAALISAIAQSTLRTDEAGAGDPMALFIASAEADAYAPLTYWHAGRWLASQGEFEAAWLCWDLARALPAAPNLTILSDASLLEARIRALAPDFFAPEGE